MTDILGEFEDQMTEFEDQPKTRQGRGVRGVLGDVAMGAVRAPVDVAKWVAGVPKGAWGAVRHPFQTAEDVGIGVAGLAGELLSTPSRMQDYYEDITGHRAKFKMPKAWDEQDLRKALGITREKSAGGQLAQDLLTAIPFVRGARALQGATGLSAGKAGAAAGAIGSGLLGGNIAEGALLGSLTDAKLPRPIDKWVQSRVAKSGLTPEEIEARRAEYRMPDGEGIPVDVGTVIDDPTLRQAYETLAKTPVVGRGARKSKLKREDMLSEKEWLEERERLLNEGHAAAEGDALLQDVDRLHKGDHEALIPEGVRQAHQDVAEQSKALYDAIPNVDNIVYTPDTAPLAEGMQKRLGKGGKEPFSYRYDNLLREFEAEAAKLEKLIKTDKPLGKDLLEAIEQGNAMRDQMTTPGAAIDLDTVLNYVKLLRQTGTVLNQKKFDIPAVKINRLASALKKDTMEVLKQMGRKDVVKAIEEADKHHAEMVIPFYSHPSVREAITNKGSILSESPYKFAKSQTPASLKALRGLPQETREAMAFEILTRGRGTSELEVLRTGKDMAKHFDALDASSKKLIKEIHPALFDRLQRVARHKRTTAEVKEALSEHTKRKPKRKMDEWNPLTDVGAIGLGGGALGAAKTAGAMGAGGLLARMLRKSLEDSGNITGERSLFRQLPRIEGAAAMTDFETEE